MFGPGRGFGNFLSFLGDVAQALGALVIVGVAVGVTVLLVRFLLVATKAAQIYVAEHTPEKPEAPTVDYRRPEPAAPAAAPAAEAAAAPEPAVATPVAPPVDEAPAAPKSASSHASAGTSTGIADAPAKPAPKPRTTKPRTPKAPPAS